MSTRRVISIKKGDADTLTDPISNLTVLTGYAAMLYIYTKAGVLTKSISGTISTSELTATYQIGNDDTKAMDVAHYDFESKIYDASDHVYTLSDGIFIIEPAKKTDL